MGNLEYYAARRDKLKVTRVSHNNNNILSTALHGSAQNIVVGYVDRDQKYTFLYNSDANVCTEHMLGKRDDEIEFNSGTIELRELKRKVTETGVAEHAIISFPVAPGFRTHSISVKPLYDESDCICGAINVSIDITDVVYAVTDNKILKGILSLCSYCKSIRNDKGEWDQVDMYIAQHSDAQISHGICPDCMKERYPEIYNKHHDSVNTRQKST